MSNLGWKSGGAEERLDRLFRQYGESAAVPEASVNFSANLWEAVESRRRARVFGLWAKFVTSGALAATLLLGVLSSPPASSVEPEYLAVYIQQPDPTPDSAELLSSILDSNDAE